MWSIQAILNPSAAVNQFNATKILNDDYPSDLAQTYYLIHGFNTYGQKTDTYHMEIHQYVTSSIYMDPSGKITALVWNPSNEQQLLTFVDDLGAKITKTIPAHSFQAIVLS